MLIYKDFVIIKTPSSNAIFSTKSMNEMSKNYALI